MQVGCTFDFDCERKHRYWPLFHRACVDLARPLLRSFAPEMLVVAIYLLIRVCAMLFPRWFGQQHPKETKNNFVSSTLVCIMYPFDVNRQSYAQTNI